MADDILILSGSILHLQYKFNALKSFLIQIGLDGHNGLPDLQLSDGHLKWVDCIKYLEVWIVEGKWFKIDCTVHRTKFLSAVFGILCDHMSEAIIWQVINQSCLPVLLYEMESVYLCPEQVNNFICCS